MRHGELRLGTFTPSVLLDAARETGALDAAGLRVAEAPVPSSPAQFASLEAGEYDAVLTSPDNVLAYRFLPGNPLGRLLDVEIVAALDRGLGLCLAARPGLDRLEPGLRLAVDVPTSGFAFVGYALLAARGLDRADCELAVLGSTPVRARALAAGECDVTILNAGNDLAARAAGCAIVASATELGPYLGTVLARLRTAPRAEAVDRLADALVATAEGIRDGSLADQATASAERVLGLPPELAAEHTAMLRDPARGLVEGGIADRPALDALVALRRRFLPVPELDDVDFAALVRPDRLAG